MRAYHDQRQGSGADRTSCGGPGRHKAFDPSGPNKNAETVGRATKRATQELTGDDKNFVVTTDLGNEFATLDRELPAEAVHRTKRPEDRLCPPHLHSCLSTARLDK